MRILLTGGSGDVGTLVSTALQKRGDTVVNIDMAKPRIGGETFVQGSILDREKLAQAMKDVDCVVHIAAWHGVHEKTKTPAEFHDLNVTGTFNVLQAAADAGVAKFIFISSTSVSDRFGLYGSTKVLGEEMVAAYAERHPDTAYMTLRPRAFIPSWNRGVYSNFLEWAAWFMRGAVHVDDFRDAVLTAIGHTPAVKAPAYIIDGAYDYSTEDLANWSDKTFFSHYAEFADVAKEHGIDTAKKPRVLEIEDHQRLPGYVPKYTMRNLLEELRDFGLQGPPAPFENAPPPRKTALKP